MAERYYLDTSIWLDYYEKRRKNGEAALKLITKIIKEASIVTYSDLHIKELKHFGYNIDEINAIFRIAKPENIRRLHIYKGQIDEANKISKYKNVPKRDILHAILARDNYCILISRDKHFFRLRNISHAKLPEDFI